MGSGSFRQKMQVAAMEAQEMEAISAEIEKKSAYFAEHGNPPSKTSYIYGMSRTERPANPDALSQA
jgi:hypothetical protein